LGNRNRGASQNAGLLDQGLRRKLYRPFSRLYFFGLGRPEETLSNQLLSDGKPEAGPNSLELIPGFGLE
jgi:hypothetical protein